MAKHRLLIAGAGRIGASFLWADAAYTHAGAARSLPDRVELVGFLEPNDERAEAAEEKWNCPAFESWEKVQKYLSPFDIVSICTQPESQAITMDSALKLGVKNFWCEKPYTVRFHVDGVVQTNYLRRADALHQSIARNHPGGTIIAFGKDDIHTRCHFEDLAHWWKAKLDYRVENGPCRYYYTQGDDVDEVGYTFQNGGLETPGNQMRDMLKNLLDHLDTGEPLWSPAR